MGKGLNLLSFILISYVVRDDLITWSWWQPFVPEPLVEILATVTGLLTGGLATMGIFSWLESRHPVEGVNPKIIIQSAMPWRRSKNWDNNSKLF